MLSYPFLLVVNVVECLRNDLQQKAFGSDPSQVLFSFSRGSFSGSVGDSEETLILTANKKIKVCMWRHPAS